MQDYSDIDKIDLDREIQARVNRDNIRDLTQCLAVNLVWFVPLVSFINFIVAYLTL